MQEYSRVRCRIDEQVGLVVQKNVPGTSFQGMFYVRLFLVSYLIENLDHGIFL